jgi:DNA-binding response OmpR family regulator
MQDRSSDSKNSSKPLGKDTRQSQSTDTVLVVDDNGRYAIEVSDAFRSAGFNTLIANDGNAAIAIALTKRPDFMVLDSRMPGRSGYLVLEYLASQMDTVIPSVMLSDNEGVRHRDYSRLLGALEFLPKPIGASEVVAVACKHMRKTHAIGN